MHVFTSLIKVKVHRIFLRDCIVGLHLAGPPEKSWEGIRVGSCQSASFFLCTNDSVLINFISTLNVIILFRIVWYFHLVVRLYKPFCEHFVT